MTEDTTEPTRSDPAGRAPGRPLAGAAGRVGFASRLRLDWWWIAILVICGGFQIYRGAGVDGVFFLVAAVALTADAAGWLARLDRYPLPRVALWLQLVLGLVVVAIVAFTPRFSAADLVAVSLVGLASVVTAWRGDELIGPSAGGERVVGAQAPKRDVVLRRAMRRTAWLWAAGGLFLCVWELAAYFQSLPSAAADYEHPPLTDLVEPLLANPTWRAIAAALWLLAGAALLQRGRRR